MLNIAGPCPVRPRNSRLFWYASTGRTDGDQQHEETERGDRGARPQRRGVAEAGGEGARWQRFTILCADNRRGIYTELTPAGRALLQKARPLHDEVLRTALGDAAEIPELAPLVHALGARSPRR